MQLRERLASVCLALAVIIPLSVPSCGADSSDAPIRVEFYIVSGYRFSWLEQRAVSRVAEEAVEEARRVLPRLPPHLLLKVRAGGNVIPETGEVSNAIGPNVIWWDVDPRHPGGVRATVNRELRASLFHAFLHLVREGPGIGRDLRDTLVGEGMAIVFERDFAHASRPWGQCGETDKARVGAVLAMSADEWGAWLAEDRRNRRWAGQRVGTCIVNAAIGASRQNVVQMASMPTDAVIRLAGF